MKLDRMIELLTWTLIIETMGITIIALITVVLKMFPFSL